MDTTNPANWPTETLRAYLQLDHSFASDNSAVMFHEAEQELKYRERVMREEELLRNHDGATPY